MSGEPPLPIIAPLLVLPLNRHHTLADIHVQLIGPGKTKINTPVPQRLLNDITFSNNSVKRHLIKFR